MFLGSRGQENSKSLERSGFAKDFLQKNSFIECMALIKVVKEVIY